MKGNVALVFLKPTTDLYLCFHTSCTPCLPEQGWFPPTPGSENRLASSVAPATRRLELVSGSESPHSNPISLLESPSICLPHPFFPPCGANRGVLLRDSKAPLLARHKTQPLRLPCSLTLVCSRLLMPGDHFLLHSGQWAIRNLYWEYPHGL